MRWQLDLLGDFRYAVRSLRRTPWYSLTIIGVVALSMTLATTVFAVVDGALFEPLPYPAPDQLYVVDGPGGGASVAQVREWAETLPDASVAEFQRGFAVGATREDRPALLQAACVGPTFFQTLGQSPRIGGFTAAHFVASTGPMPALISHRLWQTMFGSEPAVLGQRLDLAGPVNQVRSRIAGLQVVGVLPPGFVYPGDGTRVDVLLPIAPTAAQEHDRNWGQVRALIRAPGQLSAPAIKARLDALVPRQDFPLTALRAEPVVEIYPIDQLMRQLGKHELQLTFALMGAILALACVNVAGLGMARRRARAREYATRRALGATNWRLARLNLCEMTLLGGAGTLAGVWLTGLVISAVARLIPAYVVVLKAPAVDWRVLMFSAGAAVTTIAISVLTGLFSRDGRLRASSGSGASVTPRLRRSGAVLITLQVGLALAMTIGGVLIVASLWLALRQDTGYDPQGVAALELDLGAGSASDLFGRATRALQAARAVPGVEQVALSGTPILRGTSFPAQVRRPSSAGRGREQTVPVTAEFFTLMKLPAIQGRLPTSEELSNPASPVVVISERVARTFWPEESPLGKQLEWSGSRRSLVVGVVRDARYIALDAVVPTGQIYTAFNPIRTTLLIRGRGSLASVIRDGVGAMRGIPDVGVLHSGTLADAMTESVRSRAFRAWLFGGFAVVALAVAGVGILGLTAMATAGRTREVGLRYALGGQQWDVIGGFLREQVVPVMAGLALGGLVAAWNVRLLKLYLYQFAPGDFRLWAFAVSTVALTAAVGILLPAWRASRVDPVVALRVE